MSLCRVPFLSAFFVVLLLICFSCAPRESPGIELRVSADDFQTQPHFTGHIQINANAILTLILTSNVSTGYRWEKDAKINDLSILSQKEHRFVPPASDAPGAAGQEVWTFRTFRKGACTIYLTYRRPWEPGDKESWSVLLNVDVL